MVKAEVLEVIRQGGGSPDQPLHDLPVWNVAQNGQLAQQGWLPHITPIVDGLQQYLVLLLLDPIIVIEEDADVGVDVREVHCRRMLEKRASALQGACAFFRNHQ